MKNIFVILFCFIFFNCASVRVEDLTYVVGGWSQVKNVDKEIWLEKTNYVTNESLVFYKNGDIIFSEIELKPNKETEKNLKKN